MKTSPRELAELWLKDHPFHVTSRVTLSAYRADYRRLTDERRRTGECLALLMARTGIVDDWARYQAAMYWHGARRLSRLTNRYDRQLERCPRASMTLAQAMAQTLQSLGEIEDAPELVQRGRRRRAARVNLLPADWQEQLLARASVKERIVLLLFSLTGARPSELLAGVAFRIVAVSGADTLELTVAGAKRSDQSGQTARILTLASNGAQGINVRRLIQLLCNNQRAQSSSALEITGHVLICDQPRRLIDRLARAIWPELKERPTPYSFRYAFRHDCLTRGEDRAGQALALGHQSTRSAFAYGARHLGAKRQTTDLKVKADCRPRDPVHVQEGSARARWAKPTQRERERHSLRLERDRSIER